MVDSYYIVQMHLIKSPLLSVDRQHLREEQRLAQNQRYYRFLRRRQVVVHGYIAHYQYRSQRESLTLVGAPQNSRSPGCASLTGICVPAYC